MDDRTSSEIETTGGESGKTQMEGRARQVPGPFAWQPLLIGALAFFLLTGGSILNPKNLKWCMSGDPGMYLLGWMFFRNAPILQQPFGTSWQYGMDMSSSVLFADPVTLMALLLKPFKAWLPDQFQYFGIWILICYLLQAFFAWKLLSRITDRVWHKAVATLFFVLAPPFLWRLQYHFQLGAHWILLAGLYLYLAPRFRSGSWVLLLILACLITPYLLAMTMLFFCAALVKHYSQGELTLMDGAKIGVLTVVSLLFVMWEAGYFMVSGVGAGGFGLYRANLLGFLDPTVTNAYFDPGGMGGPSWSHFLVGQPKGPGDYEGFWFLGTGTLLLLIVGAAELLHSHIGSVPWRRLWPLLPISIFCVVFALSNNVSIGPFFSFHYGMPKILEQLASPLRGSGRFMWPVHYMLITGVLVIILKRFRNRASLALIGCCAFVQVVDSWPALKGIRHTYRRQLPSLGAHQVFLNSPFWQKAAQKYKKVVYVLPQDAPDNYFPLCFFAATHQLPINMGRFARVDQRELSAARLNLIHALRQGSLDRDALYVFQNQALWASGILQTWHGDWAGQVDGFRVIAPEWNPDSVQDPVSVVEKILPKYRLGTRLSLAAGTVGASYLGYGWYKPEPWGTWSNGSIASILLVLDKPPSSDISLQLDASGFVVDQCPHQEIKVFVNSAYAGEISYSLKAADGIRIIRIPQNLLGGRGRIVQIELELSNPSSPERLGLSEDQRDLALALRALTLDPL